MDKFLNESFSPFKAYMEFPWTKELKFDNIWRETGSGRLICIVMSVLISRY